MNVHTTDGPNHIQPYIKMAKLILKSTVTLPWHFQIHRVHK